MSMVEVAKMGCEITLGDRLRTCSGGDPFLVLGIASTDVPGMRLALDCWGEPIEIHDGHLYLVGIATLNGNRDRLRA